MTQADLEILCREETRQAIADNIERDPSAVALDKKIQHAALVATQVKYLQRARRKLPSYYAARAIVPPIAYEQSSSEQTAAHKDYSGDTCIDLTCGLGVDSYYLSKKFRQVITVERDPILAEVARINFGRLGAENITVVNSPSEELLAEYSSRGGKADLVYADPDRRPEGKREVRLDKGSPDIIACMPLLEKITPRVVIKASPLFDISEVFRIFGPHSSAEVVSLAGECKEIIIELDRKIAVPMVRATAIGKASAAFPFERETPPQPAFEPPYRYMAIPDAAIRKARLTESFYAESIPGAYVCRPDGYVFFNSLPHPDAMNGRIFEVTAMGGYEPSKLKRELRERGVTKAELYTLNFPYPVADICRKLGIKEGGSAKLAFTSVGKTLWSIELKEVSLS